MTQTMGLLELTINLSSQITFSNQELIIFVKNYDKNMNI